MVVCLVLGAALAPAACSSDDSAAPPVASGGTSAVGGRAGSSSGSAGTTGGSGLAAGSGGTAGASGAATGGTAGAAGSGATGDDCKVDGDCKTTGFETKPPGCAEGFCSAGFCRYRARDADGDGSRVNRCEVVSDGVITVELGKDCDDTDAKINPGAWDGPAGDGHPDACNDGIDQNCSGVEGDDLLPKGVSCQCAPGDTRACAQSSSGTPIYFPNDKPAPGSICKLGAQTCVKDPLTGGNWGPCIGAVAPGIEVCNGADDDCDGTVDEPEAADAVSYLYDADGDGFAAIDPATKKPFAVRRGCIGTPPSTAPTECTAAYCGATPLADCCPTSGWRTFAQPGDCDDRVGTVNPITLEKCNGIDDNCDGAIDDAGSVGERPYLYDGDGDGFADSTKGATVACQPPCGALTPAECAKVWRTDIPATDCNDGNDEISPGVAENCTTATDDNCNGSLVDGCDCVYDAQNPTANAQDCGKPHECVYLPKGSVCQPNGKYATCPPGKPKEMFCPDADEDGYCAQTTNQCALYCDSDSPRFPAPTKFILKRTCKATPTGQSEDCNEADASVRPSAQERCGDAVDQNCRDGNDDGYETVGSPCDYQGKALGACKQGGKLICAASGSTTIGCGQGGQPIGTNVPQVNAAPNGSRDWNCDGVLTHEVAVPRFTAPSFCQLEKDFNLTSTTNPDDWDGRKILLTDQEPVCKDTSCGAGSKGRFYAITCSGGTCTEPTSASQIGVLVCEKKAFAGCLREGGPPPAGKCPELSALLQTR